MCSLEHYLHYNYTVHSVIKINYNLQEDAVHEDAVCEGPIGEDAVREGVLFPILGLLDE